jgi:hypothetical protein
VPLFPIPTPVFHDEFSYLLGADTFARGRLANPPHALAGHFETLHVLSHPTYVSVYQPAQALALAAGQLLGHPWFGALAAGAAMCAAFVWTLAAWMPARWALLGGLLAALRLCLFNYWMNSYWGGALAAFGGALVIGAAGRLARGTGPPGRLAALMALGAVILANRRPYEGLALCAAVGVWMLLRAPVRRMVVPMALVFLPAAAWMGYYNWRTTGDPFTIPYQLANSRYKVSGFFLWEPIQASKIYPNAEMREYFTEWEVEASKARRERFLFTNLESFASVWRFFFGAALSVPLVLAAPWLWRDRRLRPLLWIGLVGALAFSLEVWQMPHYLSPYGALVWLLLVRSMRIVAAAGARGRAVVRAIVATCLAMTLAPVIATAWKFERQPSLSAWWSVDIAWDRDRIVERLETEPGSHLVIVRYLPGRSVHHEYVYNSADIDSQRIVWARELDDTPRLLEYFGDRRPWLLEVGLEGKARLSPYRRPSTGFPHKIHNGAWALR